MQDQNLCIKVTVSDRFERADPGARATRTTLVKRSEHHIYPVPPAASEDDLFDICTQLTGRFSTDRQQVFFDVDGAPLGHSWVRRQEMEATGDELKWIEAVRHELRKY